MMQFTDDEIETIKSLIEDHGFDYGLEADFRKVEKLGEKLGLWIATPDPTPEKLAEQEIKRKEFVESEFGKIMIGVFKQANENIAKQMLEWDKDNLFTSDQFTIGSSLKVRLPVDYDKSK